jgi:hypothetical protein
VRSSSRDIIVETAAHPGPGQRLRAGRGLDAARVTNVNGGILGGLVAEVSGLGLIGLSTIQGEVVTATLGRLKLPCLRVARFSGTVRLLLGETFVQSVPMVRVNALADSRSRHVNLLAVVSLHLRGVGLLGTEHDVAVGGDVVLGLVLGMGAGWIALGHTDSGDVEVLQKVDEHLSDARGPSVVDRAEVGDEARHAGRVIIDQPAHQRMSDLRCCGRIQFLSHLAPLAVAG